MGLGKTYSTQYLLDSNNNSGAANEVLISTSTGVNWTDVSDIIGGPYLKDTTDTFTGTLTIIGDIRGNGQQLILNAGESYSYATAQTGELVYLNAEAGLQVNSSPDNWATGWAGRDTATINTAGGASTFPGNVSIPVGKKIIFGGSDHTYISEDINDRLRFFTGGAEFMRFTESTADTVSIYKDTTFSTQAFAGTATSSGDASSTLTTKGYVDSLITGATIYRGTWQAGISATSTGTTSSSTTLTVSAAILDAAGNTPTLVGAVVTGAGITGTVKVASVTSSTVYELDTAIDATATAYIFSPIYGAPDLSVVTQTSGYYYICSEAGSATPNGAGTEPNTWGVGDWVIWNDDVGSGEWQKVDNSSVLSGAGTGQTVALWEGPSSVTDSETLGNAPITVSGADVTFTGTIIGEDQNSIQLILRRTSSGTDGNTSIKFEQPLGDGYLGVNASGSLAFGTAADLSTNKFTVTRDGDVGIGTTNPSSGKLVVEGAAYSISSSGQSLGGIDLRTAANGGAGSYSAGISFGGASSGRAAISGVMSPASTDGDRQGLAFFTHGSGTGSADAAEAMRISTDGNVGIGTISPTSLLEISQQLSAASTIDYPYTISSRDDGNSINQVGGEGVGIKFRIAGNAGTTPGDSLVGASIAAIREEAGDTDSSTGLGFFVTQNDETLDEAIRIDHDGNVGIGTTSPGAKFQISTPMSSTPTSNIFLDVDGTNTNGGGSSIIFGSSASAGTVTDYNAKIQGVRSSLSDGSSDLQFYTTHVTNDGAASVQRMVIKDSGNVGIGETDPQEKLDVVGNIVMDAANARLKIKSGTTGTSGGVDWTFNTASTKYARIDLDYDARATTGLLIDSGYPITMDFSTGRWAVQYNGSEKLRVATNGAIGIGGTNYGSSGQVLTSNGNAAPSWQTPTTGTVTGSGTATQVAFWDGTSSITGNDNLYWDSTNNHLGINDSTPGSALKVTSGTSETSIYTVDINHVRNDADVGTIAQRINMDLSGADTTTADRTNYGLYLDIDSSANGDASNEHRINGVGSEVNFSGYSDLVRGGLFSAESNYTGGKTAQLVGVYGQAIHDAGNVAGGVSNMYGVFGYSSIQDLGDVDNAFGGYFSVSISTNRGAANVGVTKGIEGEITIDKPDTITYGTMIGVSSIIDNNEGANPTFGAQYLFKGDYQGTKGSNAYGIYTEGDKHYFSGNIGINKTSPLATLDVADGSGNTDAALDAPVIRLTNLTESSDWDVGDKVGGLEYYTTDISGNAPYVTSFINSVNETGNGTLPSGALVFGTANYNAASGANEKMRLSEKGSLIFKNFTTSLDAPATDYLKELFIANVDGVGTFASNGASNGAYGSFKFIPRKGDSSDPTTILELTSTLATVNTRIQVGTTASSDSSIISQAGDIQLRIGSGSIEHNPYIRLQGNNGTNTTYADIQLDPVNQLLKLNDPGTSGSSIGTNPMVVNNVGKVGIYNQDPQAFLHIGAGVPTGAEALIARSNAAGTYAVSIEQDNVTGWGMLIDTDSTSAGDPTLKITGPSDTLFCVDSNGEVGIGTAGPQALLDVSKNNSVIYDPTDDLGQRTGTATIHIANQTATEDTFGQLMYDSRASGQGIARIVFLDSGSASVDIAFVTENSEVKSEKMRIASDGKVGIGTGVPGYKLDVNGNARLTGGVVTSSSQTRDKISVWSSLNTYTIGMMSGYGYGGLGGNSTGTDYAMSFQMSNTTNRGWWWGDTSHSNLQGAMSLTTTGKAVIATSLTVGYGETTRTAATTYALDVTGTIRATGDVIAYSDVRVKENIKTIDNSLEKVSKLRGVEFNKIGDNEKSIGVIAQEIEKVIPEVVKEDDKGMKSVAYGNISGLLIEAIKELKAEIEELKLNKCNCNCNK